MSRAEDRSGAGPLAALGDDGLIPDATEMKNVLVDRMTGHVARLRAERGQVTGPADTFDLIRRLADVQERMGDYQRAFGSVATTAKGFVEEELAEAVGEQEGIPTSNLTVPTAGGDITVKRNTSNVYDIDMAQVVAVLTARRAAQWRDRGEDPRGQPEEFAIDVATAALEFVGAAKPKVTVVRALAAELARDGDDHLSQAATDAIRKAVKYRGVSVDRKAPRKALPESEAS